jgi:hypothetical protein
MNETRINLFHAQLFLLQLPVSIFTEGKRS